MIHEEHEIAVAKRQLAGSFSTSLLAYNCGIVYYVSLGRIMGVACWVMNEDASLPLAPRNQTMMCLCLESRSAYLNVPGWMRIMMTSVSKPHLISLMVKLTTIVVQAFAMARKSKLMMETLYSDIVQYQLCIEEHWHWRVLTQTAYR